MTCLHLPSHSPITTSIASPCPWTFVVANQSWCIAFVGLFSLSLDKYHNIHTLTMASSQTTVIATATAAAVATGLLG